jgi:hypothetical protein
MRWLYSLPPAAATAELCSARSAITVRKVDAELSTRTG